MKTIGFHVFFFFVSNLLDLGNRSRLNCKFSVVLPIYKDNSFFSFRPNAYSSSFYCIWRHKRVSAFPVESLLNLEGARASVGLQILLETVEVTIERLQVQKGSIHFLIFDSGGYLFAEIELVVHGLDHGGTVDCDFREHASHDLAVGVLIVNQAVVDLNKLGHKNDIEN